MTTEDAYKKAVELVAFSITRLPEGSFRADSLILGVMDRLLVKQPKPIEELLAITGGAYGYSQLKQADPELVNQLIGMFRIQTDGDLAN